MKWVVLAILACLVLLSLAEGDVVVLTDENFESYISKPVIMIKFFAPWCGHCKSFAPEYEKAAKMVKEQNKSYILAELDATVHTKAAGKYNIQGFPTIKLLVNGVVMDYGGERKAEAVLAYIDKKILPATSELPDAAAVKEKQAAKGRRCILISDDPKIRDEYANIARTVDEYTFYVTSESVGKEMYPKVGGPAVVLLKDYDEQEAVYIDAIEPERFKAFLSRHQFPLIAELNEEVVKMIFQRNERTGIFLFRSAAADSAKSLEAEFRKFAEAKKSPRYAFVVCDIKSGWDQRLAEYFGIDEASLPVVEAVKPETGISRFRHLGKIELPALVTFMADLELGKIPRYLKSEPIPESNPGPVFKAVGKNFKEDVMDNDMDVLVKFYAEWCGHCKKLAPIYVATAEALKANKKLKFVEIDATKNDVEGQQVSSFPTLKLFTGKDKANPINFDGERTEEGITKFLKEKCATPLIAPEAAKPKESL